MNNFTHSVRIFERLNFCLFNPVIIEYIDSHIPKLFFYKLRLRY